MIRPFLKASWYVNDFVHTTWRRPLVVCTSARQCLCMPFGYVVLTINGKKRTVQAVGRRPLDRLKNRVLTHRFSNHHPGNRRKCVPARHLPNRHPTVNIVSDSGMPLLKRLGVKFDIIFPSFVQRDRCDRMRELLSVSPCFSSCVYR